MGLTMETGTIIHWLKQEGEPVKAGEPLLEIETDKASVEIEALESGTLQKIVAGPDEEIPVGAVIGYLLKSGEAADQEVPALAPAALDASPVPFVSVAPDSSLPVVLPVGQKVKASPAARKLAKSLQVDLARVKGSGPDGRIVAWNVSDVAKSPVSEAQALQAQEPSMRVSPVAQRVAAEWQRSGGRYHASRC
jgi:pyruvate dehydrogenase E2 component (dihydrolipoamide acetyltransferase)